MFLYAKRFRADFLFLHETHSTANEVNFWRSQWGNDIWLSHGSEHSAGVGTLKCNFTGNILHSDIDINGHFVCQVIDFNKIILIVTNVYGYNTKVGNENLFDTIEQKLLIWLNKFPNAFLLMGGDFNVALDNALDRWLSRQNNNETCHLKLFMQRFDLINIWREKFPTDRVYTWSNKTGSSQSRIDYWLNIEFVVSVEIYDWVVISESLDLNEKKQKTAVVGKHSSHFLQQIQLRLHHHKGT